MPALKGSLGQMETNSWEKTRVPLKTDIFYIWCNDVSICFLMKCGERGWGLVHKK